MVFGVGGSNGAICSSIKSKMVAGGRLGMMALSRVTLAAAGLSCSLFCCYILGGAGASEKTRRKATAASQQSKAASG